LSNQNIQTGVHYPISLPKLKAYGYTGQADEMMFANSSDASLLSLPIGEHLSEEDVMHVVNIIKKFFNNIDP